jgi:hypothetical protein
MAVIPLITFFAGELMAVDDKTGDLDESTPKGEVFKAARPRSRPQRRRRPAFGPDVAVGVRLSVQTPTNPGVRLSVQTPVVGPERGVPDRCVAGQVRPPGPARPGGGQGLGGGPRDHGSRNQHLRRRETAVLIESMT